MMESIGEAALQDEEEDGIDLEPLIGSPAVEGTLKDDRGSQTFLYITSIMAAIGGISFGYDMGIISGAMLQLVDDLDLSSHQQEVIVSAMLVGGLIGSLFGGFFLDWFGRRLTIIGNTTLFFIGALVMSSATSYHTLVIGRLIAGIAMAVSGIGESVYVSEISPQDKRGSLVLLNETGICSGILIAYLVSFLFINTDGGWRYMFLLSAVPAVVQAVGMYLLPSSPRFLLMSGRDSEAQDTLSRLRGTPHVQEEWVELKSALYIQQKQTHRCLDLCSTRRNLRGRMLIAVGLVVFENLTGQTTVIYYAPTIFQMLGFSSDSTATLATVGLGFTKLFASIIALFSVDVAGRRQLLLLGGSIMTVVIAILGAVVKTPVDKSAVITLPVYTSSPDNLRHFTRRTVQSLNITHSQYRKGEKDEHFEIDNFTELGFVRRSRKNLKYFSEPLEDSYLRGTLERTPRSIDDSQSMQQKTYWVKAVAVVSLMLYVFAFSLGYGPVVWLLLSELFPADVRGRAASLANAMNFVTNILINMTFLDIVGSIGVSTTFLTFAVICLLAVLYIYWFIPETKGCSLEQISQQLSQRTFCNRTSGGSGGIYCLGYSSDNHIA